MVAREAATSEAANALARSVVAANAANAVATNASVRSVVAANAVVANAVSAERYMEVNHKQDKKLPFRNFRVTQLLVN